jgi:hypothetical protein
MQVLTEGWDDPPTSCVIILRMSCFESTILQMIGRGLRPNPGSDKCDCLILDFGISLLSNHDVLSKAGLVEWEGVQPRVKNESTGMGNNGPSSGSKDFPTGEPDKVITMRPFQLLRDESDFLWLDNVIIPRFSDDVFQRAGVQFCVATTARSWAGVFLAGTGSGTETEWVTIGGNNGNNAPAPRLLYRGNYVLAFAAATDFMNGSNTDALAKESVAWKNASATEKQKSCLWASFRSRLNYNKLRRSEAAVAVVLIQNSADIRFILDSSGSLQTSDHQFRILWIDPTGEGKCLMRLTLNITDSADKFGWVGVFQVTSRAVGSEQWVGLSKHSQETVLCMTSDKEAASCAKNKPVFETSGD